MEQNNRYYYHSFPRIRPDDNREHIIKIGLETLKTITQIGLVLAPEILVWKQWLQDNEYRTTIIKQNRICFTELSRKEIGEHGKKFGPFSLEYNIDTLRRLGALPVIYMPQHLKDDETFSKVGDLVVTELADIKYTIDMLHQLFQTSDPAYILSSTKGSYTSVSPDCIINLQNKDEANNVVASYPVPLKYVKDILSYIGYRNAPFELMIGVLSLVQSLFYPTDDKIHDNLLDYYRQREWRLVSGLSLKGKSQCRSLNDIEKQSLLNIDNIFWSKELSDGKSSSRRIDDASLVETTDGRNIIEMCSAIIVPSEVYSEARELFGDKVIIEN